MMKMFFAVWMLSCVVLLPSRGEEDTFKNIYHSLNRLGNNIRNVFTEDSDDQPSPTPGRHRKSASKHLSSRKRTSQHSNSAGESSTGDADASDETSKSSAKAKKDAGAGDDKPGSSPDSTPSPGQGTAADSGNKPESAAPMATIKPEALQEFSEQPPEVQQLMRNSLALTEKNLSYKYGSADPAAGGMDCSGFIYFVLGDAGYKDVPRDSAGQYSWLREKGNFHAVLSRSEDSFELKDLRPGNLLFWSGTYKIDRDNPITHVMIYLGKEKSTGKPVMVGATDGRTYDGIRRYGVSVFDFKMPSGKPNKDDPGLTARFEGYASLPGLHEANPASKNQVKPEQVTQSDKESSANAKAKPTPDLGNGD